MTQATLVMGAFVFLVIVGSSMGSFGTGYRQRDLEAAHGARSLYPTAKKCTTEDVFTLLDIASRCSKRGPEGISYSFNDIR